MGAHLTLVAFVQHLQCVDIPRMQRLKPWLDIEDIVLEEMLKAMSTYCEKCALADKAKQAISAFSSPGAKSTPWVPLAIAFCAITALALM